MDGSSLLLFLVPPRGRRCSERFSHVFPTSGACGMRRVYLGYTTAVMGLPACPLCAMS